MLTFYSDIKLRSANKKEQKKSLSFGVSFGLQSAGDLIQVLRFRVCGDFFMKFLRLESLVFVSSSINSSMKRGLSQSVVLESFLIYIDF